MLHTEFSERGVVRGVPQIARDLVGKVALCEALGWSRPKLDRRLEADQHFPVMYRGGQGKGRGWQFDLEAVKSYLGNALAEEKIAAPPEPNPKPTTAATHSGERTARQRRDEAMAALSENKLKLASGDLMEAEDVRTAIAQMMLHLGKGLDALPEQIIRHLGLSEQHAGTIRALIDKQRLAMVGDLRAVLGA